MSEENIKSFLGRSKKSVIEGIHDSVISQIPSDFIRDVPDYRVVYLIGISSGAFFFGLWAFFTWNSLTTLDSPFLSTETEGLLCEEVPRANSGTYLATDDGYWIGSEFFSISRAILSFTVSNTLITNDEWKEYIAVVYSYFKVMGGLMKGFGPARVMTTWLAASLRTAVGGGSQRIEFTAVPEVVFDRENTFGHLVSSRGACSASGSSLFDASLGNFHLRFNYDEFMNDPACSGIGFSPSLLGRAPGMQDGVLLDFKLDSHAIITALAVNIGVVSMDDLVTVTSKSGSVYDHETGANFTYVQAYHPKYLFMDLVTCFPVSTTTLCTISIGNLYGVPFLNHRGRSDSSPKICTPPCSSIPADTPNSDVCFSFQFITGFLFWPSTADNSLAVTARNMLRLYKEYGSWDNFANSKKGIYPMAFYSSYWGQQALAVNAVVSGSEQRLTQYYYNASCHGCNMVSFSTFDYNQTSFDVSSAYYQLPHMACRDSVSATADVWARLADKPFSQLTESYYKCKYPFSSLVVQAAGAAMGNVGALFPIAMLLLVGTVMLLQRWRIVPDFYKKSEREEIIEGLSLLLLHCRDGHLPKALLLAQLVRECQNLALDDDDSEQTETFNGDENSVFKESSDREKTTRIFKKRGPTDSTAPIPAASGSSDRYDDRYISPSKDVYSGSYAEEYRRALAQSVPLQPRRTAEKSAKK